jgi:hypothetical protein
MRGKGCLERVYLIQAKRHASTGNAASNKRRKQGFEHFALTAISSNAL